MAAVVHMDRPTSARTFTKYVTQHLVPFIKSRITPSVTRVNAVSDTYPEDNLKTLAHQRCGSGSRTRIGDGHTRIPKHDWSSGFLKNTDNKKELFPFLSKEIVKTLRCFHPTTMQPCSSSYQNFPSSRTCSTAWSPIGQSVAKILRFFDFSKWRPPPSWIFKFVKCY